MKKEKNKRIVLVGFLLILQILIILVFIKMVIKKPNTTNTNIPNIEITD